MSQTSVVVAVLVHGTEPGQVDTVGREQKTLCGELGGLAKFPPGLWGEGGKEK